MQPHKHHLIMIQYALGSKVEFYCTSYHKWLSAPIPNFGEDVDYRIAPGSTAEVLDLELKVKQAQLDYEILKKFRSAETIALTEQLTESREAYTTLLQAYMKLKLSYTALCNAIDDLPERETK